MFGGSGSRGNPRFKSSEPPKKDSAFDVGVCCDALPLLLLLPLLYLAAVAVVVSPYDEER